MQIQLRRPSDGAVSESRSFEFIPLDAGRAYWSAKRLKTNFSVFNQILTRDQALRQGESQPPTQQQELKHKVPMSRAPVMAGLFAGPPETVGVGDMTVNVDNGAGAESSQSSQLAAGQMRQTLKPVAMPGMASTPVNFPGPGQMITDNTLLQSKPEVTPQIPTRSPQKSTGPAFGVVSSRPTSDMSIISDFSSLTQPDNISLATTTRQSVNEILSLADVSVYSGDTINLDNISVNTLLNNPLGMQQPLMNTNIKEEPQDAVTNSSSNLSNVATTLGSLTSVATVKECIKPDPPNFSPMDVTDITTESVNNVAMDTMDSLDLDIGQIYDDVMQCVYDDVDVKYDDVTMLMDQPPVPPQRRNKELETNIDADIIAEIDKPLPAAPKNNILTKLTEKKNELLIAREKEIEKKRKEKEEIEEQRRKEKEDKDKKKREEREAKKKEEEEKKAKEEQKMKSSLFQRLFQRSQSRNAELSDMMEEHQDGASLTSSGPGDDETLPPPPPPHQQAFMSQMSMDARLSELEQLIGAANSGVGEHLESLDDTIVTEFTSQYPPESGSTADIRPDQSQTVQT